MDISLDNTTVIVVVSQTAIGLDTYWFVQTLQNHKQGVSVGQCSAEQSGILNEVGQHPSVGQLSKHSLNPSLG